MTYEMSDVIPNLRAELCVCVVDAQGKTTLLRHIAAREMHRPQACHTMRAVLKPFLSVCEAQRCQGYSDTNAHFVRWRKHRDRFHEIQLKKLQLLASIPMHVAGF